MPQDWKLLSFEKSDFQDTTGNFWCQATFEGFGEPIKWVMQAKTVATVQVGESYYGEIRDWTSAKGGVFPRFYREKREDGHTAPQHPAQGPQVEMIGQPAPQREWVDKSDTIRAQWAIGQARKWVTAHPSQVFDDIPTEAKKFYALVDVILGSSPKAEAPLTQSIEEQQAQREATRDAERLKQIGSEEPPKSWVDDIAPVGDEPINLDDIPF